MQAENAEAPVLATVAASALFAATATANGAATTAAKPSAFEFSPALDSLMIEVVRSAAASDDCAGALADHGRLPPVVLVEGAKVALAGCCSAALEALRVHGLSANDVLQAVSAVDLYAVFAKSPVEQILAVMKTVEAIMPQSNYLQKITCSHAFACGRLELLKHFAVTVPHACGRDTMAKLVESGRVCESDFCTVYERWMQQNGQWSGVSEEEIRACVNRDWPRAVLLLLMAGPGASRQWCPRRALDAVFFALNACANNVLDAVVAAGPLEFSNTSRPWRNAEHYSYNWKEAIMGHSSQSRAIAALTLAAKNYPTATGLQLIAKALQRSVCFSQHALDAICVPEVATALSNMNIKQVFDTIVENRPTANLLAFFNTYGHGLNVSPTATKAPDVELIYKLIRIGADPKIFALLPPHECDMQNLSNILGGNCDREKEIPPESVWDAFESFYNKGVCLSVSRLVSGLAGCLLRRNQEKDRLTNVLTRFARVCALDSWNMDMIFDYLVYTNSPLLLFCEYCVTPRCLRPAAIRTHLVKISDSASFAVLARKIPLTPGVASSYLLLAVLAEATKIAEMCREAGGTISGELRTELLKYLETLPSETRTAVSARYKKNGIYRLTEKDMDAIWKDIARVDTAARKMALKPSAGAAGAASSSARSCVVM